MTVFNAFSPPKPTPEEVWLKGHIIPGYDPAVWRRDDFGNVMRFTDHGNRNSDYGWERDHIIAVAAGGHDGIGNIRPLHWRANAGLGGMLQNALAKRY